MAPQHLAESLCVLEEPVKFDIDVPLGLLELSVDRLSSFTCPAHSQNIGRRQNRGQNIKDRCVGHIDEQAEQGTMSDARVFEVHASLTNQRLATVVREDDEGEMAESRGKRHLSAGGAALADLDAHTRRHIILHLDRRPKDLYLYLLIAFGSYHRSPWSKFQC